MKKGLSVLMIAAAFIFAACDSSGGGGTPPEDNPQTGEMTAATAAKIFDSKNVSGGLEIVKFKGAAALETYLSEGSGAVAAFRAPNRAPGLTVFFLNTIGGRPIVRIADNAFNPDPALKGAAALPAGLSIKLPEKLAFIGKGVFNGSGVKTLIVPAAITNTTVLAAIDEAAEEAGVDVETETDDDMVKVTGGSFTMGGGASVTVADFYIAKYEVTQELYQAVTGANPSQNDGALTPGEEQQKRPVQHITWYEAVEFCNKLSQREGLTPYYVIDKNTADSDPDDDFEWEVTRNATANGYRLPTDAEWEYAAKGGHNGSVDNYIHAGSNTVDEVAWYTDNTDVSHQVGKKAPNKLGLYDMSGNIWEWVWDLFDNTGTARIRRGGDWGAALDSVRCDSRENRSPYSQAGNTGFRLARNL